MKARRAVGAMLACAVLFCPCEGALRGACADGEGSEGVEGVEGKVRIAVQTVVTPAQESRFDAVISLEELPDGGISAVEFAVAYDAAVLSIHDVELLYDTGADEAEALVNPDLAGSVFSYEDTGGEIRIRWATALVSPEYWLRETRAFLCVHGEFSSEAAAGAMSALEVVPYGSNQEAVVAGRLDEEGNIRSFTTEAQSGSVRRSVDETGATMYGDTDFDGARSVADAVLLQRVIAEEEALSAAAYANADCAFDGELTIADVTLLLSFLSEKAGAEALGAH